MSGILKPVLSIEQQAARDPHFANTLAMLITDKTPCATCGLERFGHGPDTVKAGNEPHRYN